MTKEMKYAALINDKVAELFSEADGDLSLKDLDATAFFHAFATLAPCFMYGKITGQQVDALGFNHIANRLIMQFSDVLETDD